MSSLGKVGLESFGEETKQQEVGKPLAAISHSLRSKEKKNSCHKTKSEVVQITNPCFKNIIMHFNLTFRAI